MREIKFRAWCQRLKKYYFNVGTHPSIMQWCEDYKKESPGALIVSPLYENYIIEQFTGLRDKNGREIYEGDIVTVDGVLYFVEWRGAGDWFIDPECDDAFMFTPSIYELEIIGNIHENPELLS